MLLFAPQTRKSWYNQSVATNINGVIVQDPLNDKAWTEVKRELEKLSRENQKLRQDIDNLKQRLGVR